MKTLTLEKLNKILNMPACTGILKGRDGSYCAIGKLEFFIGGYSWLDESNEIAKINNYTAANEKLATYCNDYRVPYAVPQGIAFGPEKKKAWKRHLKATAMAFLNCKDIKIKPDAMKKLEELAK